MARDWRLDALCRNASKVDRALPFGLPAKQEEFVQRFCRRCPVVGSCLEFAVLTEAGLPVSHRNGVFGAWTSTERAALDAGRVWRCSDCPELVAAKTSQQLRCERCRKRAKAAATAEFVARSRERAARAAAGEVAA